MDKKISKKIFNIVIISFFIVFWLLPSFILGSGFFIEDIGWYFEYMLKIFPILFIIFFVIFFKFSEYNKKRVLFLLGLSILVLIISGLLVFFRIVIDFQDATFAI